MSSLSSKIASNTLAQVAGKTASTTLGVAITFLLTRYLLNHHDYGVYTFSFVFVTLFGSFADWGLSLITVRETSKKPEMAGKIIGNVIVIRFILAVIAAIVAGLIINLSNYDAVTKTVTSIFCLYLVASSLKTSFQIIFQAKLEMHKWAISEVSSNALTILLFILALNMGWGLIFVVVAFLLGDFLSAFVAYVLARRSLNFKFSLKMTDTKYLLLETVPMGTLLVVFTIYNRIDTVILSYFKGANAVADYGLAYRIYEVVVLGAAYFSNSVLPIISRLAVEDRSRLALFFRKAFVVLLILGLLAALCTFTFADIGITILGGHGYSPAVTALRLLSLALVFSYFNHLTGYTLVALNKQTTSLKIALVALTVNVVLNLLLIPSFSLNGAALITVATEALIVILSLLAIYRTINTRPHLSDLWVVTKELITKRGHVF